MKELMFLDLVLNYRFNWEEIALHINKDHQTSKTAEELKEHYLSLFVEGNIGEATWPSRQPFAHDDAGPPIQCLSGSSIVKYDSESDDVFNEIEYSPKRDSFEREFFSNYDCIVGSLKGKHEDELMKTIELTCLDIYQRKVRERYKLKKLVTDYKLIHRFIEVFKSERANDTHRDKTKDKMNLICRLIPASDHEAILQGESKEQKLRSRIKELKEQLTKSPSSAKSKELSKFSPKGTDLPPQGRQSKSKENKHKKNSTLASQSNASQKKENKNSSPIPFGKGKKRLLYEEDSNETVYTTNTRDLLSQAERTLCSNLDMDPSSYMALKIVLLREKNNASNSAQIWNGPAPKRNHGVEVVTDFMAQNGWIKTG